jgi:uncharacterized membrane protein YhaH (DUF805 family)
MNFGQLLFSFQGRINRAKYWLAVLIYVIVGLVMATISYIADQATPAQLLSLIVNIGVAVSSIAVGIKRLHDRDKSGWWLLLFYLVPSLLMGIGAVAFYYGIGDESAGGIIGGSIAYILGLVFLIWAFIELGCLRGTPGPNRFGPDPLASPTT